MGEVLLKVENLKMVFQNKKSSFAAVEGLSFTVEQGKTLGIVGESGSGKTMASLRTAAASESGKGGGR